jgi:hypothetical protein
LKRKRPPESIQQEKFIDYDKIYVYQRKTTLLNPIPYKWKMNIIEFQKIKNLIEKNGNGSKNKG